MITTQLTLPRTRIIKIKIALQKVRILVEMFTYIKQVFWMHMDLYSITVKKSL